MAPGTAWPMPITDLFRVRPHIGHMHAPGWRRPGHASQIAISLARSLVQFGARCLSQLKQSGAHATWTEKRTKFMLNVLGGKMCERA